MLQIFKFIDTQKYDALISSKVFPFTKNLFWNIAIESLDFKLHKRYIIERILMRGFTQDIYVLLKIYSADEIITAIKKSKELDAKTLNFWALHYNLKKEDLHASLFYSR